jgi:hypothetical protein
LLIYLGEVEINSGYRTILQHLLKVGVGSMTKLPMELVKQNLGCQGTKGLISMRYPIEAVYFWYRGYDVPAKTLPDLASPIPEGDIKTGIVKTAE